MICSYHLVPHFVANFEHHYGGWFDKECPVSSLLVKLCMWYCNEYHFIFHYSFTIAKECFKLSIKDSKKKRSDNELICVGTYPVSVRSCLKPIFYIALT